MVASWTIKGVGKIKQIEDIGHEDRSHLNMFLGVCSSAFGWTVG